MADHTPIQGDVVLLAVGGNRRPAVVVSSNWYNSRRDECVVAGITAQVPDELERDQVRLTEADANQAGLPGAAIVVAGKVFAVPRASIAKPLGRLPDKSLHAVLERLSEVLGLL